MFWAKDIRGVELIPKGYGVSYVHWNRDMATCHPIPINLTVSAVRSLYHWVICFKPSVLDKAHTLGVQMGQGQVRTELAQEYNRGLNDGYTKAIKEMASIIRGELGGG